ACRLGGLVATAPPLSSIHVPWRARVGQTVAASLVIAPTQSLGRTDLFYPWPNLLVACGEEAMLGLALGLGTSLMFSAAQAAGGLIGLMSGLGVSGDADPSEGGSPLARFHHWVCLAAFLSVGGHRLVLGGLLDSFEALPPGRGGLIGPTVDGLLLLASQSFALTIRLAAPAAVAVALTTLALGLVSRMAPPINNMSVGLGGHALTAWFGLPFSLAAMAWAFQGAAGNSVEIFLERLVR
ncbi:MAG: flagellar biosynthetic protein FliR, partial [Planctomycetales bacterium]